MSLLTAALALSAWAAPVHNLELTVQEDMSVQGQVPASVKPGESVEMKLKQQPKHGQATLDAATGAFSYTPAPDFNGEDACAVEVTAGKRLSTVKIALHVEPENDAPTVKPLSLSTVEDAATHGTIVASDLDHDILTYRVSAQPAHGEASIDHKSGVATYRPAADTFGNDAFTVEVSDGAAVVTVEVPVTVAAVNDAPVAKASSHDLQEDSTYSGVCGAADVDGDALTFKVGQKPKHGELEINASTGAFTYAPARDYHGVDSFTFGVSDGKLSSEAVVRLVVKAVNDAPMSQAMSMSGMEDESLYGIVTASDVDGDRLAYSVSSVPAHGKAHVDATGAVTYQPDADYNGADTFEVTVSDGTLTSTSAVTVALAAVDDKPVVKPMTLEAKEDAESQACFPASDVDHDVLTYKLTSQPKLGKVEIVDAAAGTWRFVPRADLNGDDAFSFTVSDGHTTVPGTVKLHVAAVNDAPTLAALSLKTDEDTWVEGQLKGTDIDGDMLSYAIVEPPKHGRAVVEPVSGKVRFEPTANFNGKDTFTVAVNDGVTSSEPMTVSVDVKAVNDAPVAKAMRIVTDEDTEGFGKPEATDVDGDAVKFTIISRPKHGMVVLTDGFAYTPDPNYNGPDSFLFAATDPAGGTSTAEVTIAVVAVNDAPEAFTDEIAGPCHGSITGRMHGFDREGKPLTFRVAKGPLRGRVQVKDAKTGEFIFYSDGGNDEESTFEFVTSDGQLESEPAPFTVHVQSACIVGQTASR